MKNRLVFAVSRGLRGLAVIVIVAALLNGCGPQGLSGSGTVDLSREAISTQYGLPDNLPLPSALPRDAYEAQLYSFLGTLTYRSLGWKKDKGVRDTGPFKNGTYYGTHPAVRMYYSPDYFVWLKNGRQGIIPDGAMVIKEMYPPPAARYQGLNPNTQLPMPTWTVMVRDSQASNDGWWYTYFDSNPNGTTPPQPQPVDTYAFPFSYPNSGFGLYCVRCHASAESQLVFSSLENVEGEPGTPMVYPDDGSWKTMAVKDIRMAENHGPRTPPPSTESTFTNPLWAAAYPQMTPPTKVESIPPRTRSHVVGGKGNQFVTSDQCQSCHSGDNSPFGPNMVADNGKVDLSPFGEWSWSMMGLAGRDPVFYAQLESEVALHPAQGQMTPESIQNTCLRCHGVMGQRQFHLDKGDTPNFLVAEALDPFSKYGGLARDGISCTVCHQIAPNDDVSLDTIDTGRFAVNPLDSSGNLVINGPAQTPTEAPMLKSVGARPVYQPFIAESRLCASCHTVNLPVLDASNNVVTTRYEQATYLEWENSAFRDGGPQATSCQTCHMPDTYHGQKLSFKYANIQDQDFPPTTFLAPLSDILVQPRANYNRHVLLGINQFVLEMFNQFSGVLGVTQSDYMSGLSNQLQMAIENSNTDALQNTAGITLQSVSHNGDQITAQVRVDNRTGHRFPSGVGFRRAFIEVTVADANGTVIWGSGRTDALGRIVGANGQPLPSESFAVDPNTNQQAFQPHYQTVTSEDQAQIFEEIVKDLDGNITTSFLSRATDAKDNRLLPVGWTTQGPPGMEEKYVEPTRPFGDAATDPDFVGGSDTMTYTATLPNNAQGPFTVRAQLYYQSIPPTFLGQRFSNAQGPATQRLYYLGQHLDTSKTHVTSWKLLVNAASTTTP